jgi:general secretion pathway protein B
VRTPRLNELPDDLQREVPAMAISGSVYSPQPASRMLIVNGQVFREGSTLAAGLRLEQIGPKSAVFSVRGQRFELPY